MLVLSIFPGIDLLGRGFEAEGFCVVRGPDLIWGGDIKSFHPPSRVFDGVIGGPPCQDFSAARRTQPTGDGLEMMGEYRRVVMEAAPQWWLMENVARVPDLKIPPYSWQRLDLRATEFGLAQSRLRHFQFGDLAGRTLTMARGPVRPATEPCCLASTPGGRDWERFCELQGLPKTFNIPSFTIAAKFAAVGNGVPVPVAAAVARAIKNLGQSTAPACLCGCGRPIFGKQITATAACRKRLQRRREK